MKKLIAVGVVSLLTFAASAVVAAIILDHDHDRYVERGIAEVPEPVRTRQAEVGLIDMPLFEGDDRLDRWRKEKHQALHGYGWVDRKKGTIHIPIEQAMTEVVRQAAQGGKP
jgi:hypothetical protein